MIFQIHGATAYPYGIYNLTQNRGFVNVGPITYPSEDALSAVKFCAFCASLRPFLSMNPCPSVPIRG